MNCSISGLERKYQEQNVSITEWRLWSGTGHILWGKPGTWHVLQENPGIVLGNLSWPHILSEIKTRKIQIGAGLVWQGYQNCPWPIQLSWLATLLGLYSTVYQTHRNEIEWRLLIDNSKRNWSGWEQRVCDTILSNWENEVLTCPLTWSHINWPNDQYYWR